MAFLGIDIGELYFPSVTIGGIETLKINRRQLGERLGMTQPRVARGRTMTLQSTC
jgi:hypothetical protein